MDERAIDVRGPLSQRTEQPEHDRQLHFVVEREPRDEDIAQSFEKHED